MKSYYLVIVCLFVSTFSSYGQSDCNSALNLCTDANSGGVVNGYGNDDFNGRSILGCLNLNLEGTAIEAHSYWFKVKLAKDGEFGFNIKPNNLTEDWDFAVFGPNPTCGALGEPLKCNYRGGSGGYTGVGVDPTTNTQTNFYDSWIDGKTGDEFVVYVNQYSGSNAGFSITWEGAVMDKADPLDCSILVDLGPDRNLCVGKSTVLNATYFGAVVTYEWFLETLIPGDFQPLSPAQSSPTLLVNTSGNYKVKVTDTGTGNVLEDDIVITFADIPIAGIPGDMISCDNNVSGSVLFDLETQTNDIINGQIGMTVTYHHSKPFAQAGVAPITGAFDSSGETIWARIENSANGACYDVISFDLSIVAKSRAELAPNLKMCDDDDDGKMIFNLDGQSSAIIDGQLGMNITYYENENNALDYKGWILNTSTYTSNSKTIWARVEPTLGSGCPAFTSFDLEVLQSPIANTPSEVKVCDDNNDGIYSFDLNAMVDAEILGTQSPLSYSVTYFRTQFDADANINVLAMPYQNATPYALETVFARISNSGFSDCYNTTSFTTQVFDNAFPPNPGDIPSYVVCDDMSDGNDTDGFHSFDLSSYDEIILNGQSSFVFDVSYYEDAAYMNQIVDPINYSNSVSGGQTIFALVRNTHPNNTICSTRTSFDLEVLPLPNAMLVPFNFVQCDEDGTADGIVDFNMAEADTFITFGNTSLGVSYHLTPMDAAAGINIQNKNSFSNGTASTLYARVRGVNGCYRVVTVNLVVSSTSFPPDYHREIISCDDDSVIDGIHAFNLNQIVSEILALFLPNDNLRVSFYRNEYDALAETNYINETDAYLNEVPFNQTIWVRVESSINGGCFGVAPVLDLIVNPRPEFELDEIGILCLNNVPATVTTYNPNDFYTYEWTDASNNVISDQPFAEIIAGGVYTVIATSNLGCQSFPQTITIEESDIATIEPDDVIVIDNSRNNVMEVIASNQNLGIGDYEFSLNDSFGPYQDSPVFSNVIPGKQTLFVRDKNDCGIAQVEVYVLGFPNFFTPNNDRSNDTWQVRGIDHAVFPESNILIYDRYGKLLSRFDADDVGWDGTIGNIPALSTDYWYIVELRDVNGEELVYKGHFSLVRR